MAKSTGTIEIPMMEFVTLIQKYNPLYNPNLSPEQALKWQFGPPYIDYKNGVVNIDYVAGRTAPNTWVPKPELFDDIEKYYAFMKQIKPDFDPGIPYTGV